MLTMLCNQSLIHCSKPVFAATRVVLFVAYQAIELSFHFIPVPIHNCARDNVIDNSQAATRFRLSFKCQLTLFPIPFSLTMLELSNNKNLESLPLGLEKLTYLTAVHIPNCHPDLVRSPGVQAVLSVINKNKTSDLVETMSVKQLPVSHEFDVSVNRPIEMVDIDRPQ